MSTVHIKHPPFAHVTPVNHGGGDRWCWQVVSDFGENEERKWRWAYWCRDGEWHYDHSSSSYCEGETLTRWGAERQARRALRRLDRTLRFLEQDRVTVRG